jgi:hypothetical protein
VRPFVVRVLWALFYATIYACGGAVEVPPSTDGGDPVVGIHEACPAHVDALGAACEILHVERCGQAQDTCDLGLVCTAGVCEVRP